MQQATEVREGIGPMEGQFQVVVSPCMGAKAKPKSSM